MIIDVIFERYPDSMTNEDKENVIEILNNLYINKNDQITSLIDIMSEYLHN